MLIADWIYRLQGMGFERGWGDNAERVLNMMLLLSDILQAPDPASLETFLGKLPMIFNVVLLSIHGYFGQANVLGLPDTGGQVHTSVIRGFFYLQLRVNLCLENLQVVYILDQVRSLENEMLLKLRQQGLDIKPKILIVRIFFIKSR